MSTTDLPQAVRAEQWAQRQMTPSQWREFVRDELHQVDYARIDPETYRGYARYLFLDLDLTCTNSMQVLDSRLFAYLARLERQKILLTIPTTGRVLAAVTFLCRDMGLPVVGIATNGSSVAYKARENQHVSLKIQRAHQQPILLLVLKILREKYGLHYTINWPHSQNTDLPLKAQCIGSIPRLQHILDHDQDIQRIVAPWGGVSLIDSLGPIVHLQLSCYTKGRTLQKFCEALEIPLERRVYAGNGVNDCSARPYVSHFICVANGEACVKELADYVAQRASAQGTIEGLYRYLLDAGLNPPVPTQYAV